MKRVVSLLLALALLTGAAGCGQSGQDRGSGEPGVSSSSRMAHPQATAKPTPEPGTLSGELTIAYPGYGGGSNYLLDEEIAGFQKLHPEVHINVYQDGIDLEQGYVEKVTVGLMSGEPVDIVESSFLNLKKFGDSGVLLDLNDYFDWDPDRYYLNIAEACTVGGALVGIPAAFSPVVVWTDKSVTDALGIDMTQYDSISYSELAEIQNRALSEGLREEPYYLFEESSRTHMLLNEFPSFMDVENKAPHFDSPEFISYLESLKSFQAKSSADTVLSTSAGPAFKDAFAKQGYGGSDSVAFPIHTAENINQALPLRLYNGERPFLVAEMLSIPSSAPNKELAWEFLRYVYEGGIESTAGTLLAVPGLSKEGWHEYIQQNYARSYAFKDGVDMEEAMASLDAFMGELNYWSTRDRALLEPLEEAMIQYFDNDLGTAEDLAKQLQERTWIYMNE